MAIPDKSGMDHWMVGQIYATAFLLLSSVGIPAGILNLKFCHIRRERICGAVTLAASALFLGIGICLWVFWP